MNKSMIHIKKRLKVQDGYLTIETTMVFSVLFFSLILILFVGMVMYQNVNLQSIAVQASERGSVVYSSWVADMTTGVKTLDDFLIRDPYRNVPFMDGGSKEDYASIINTYINGRMGRRDIIRGEVKNSGDYVEVEDYLIEKRIKVNIRSDYQMPVNSIAEMFGRKGPFTVDTTAVSAVIDSPDFVRNVDLAMDVIRQTDVFDAAQDADQKSKDDLTSVTDLVQ